MAAFNGLCPPKIPYSKATLWSEWGSLLPVFWQCYLETGKEMPKRNNKTHKKMSPKMHSVRWKWKLRKQFALIWLGIEIGPCSHDGLSGHKFVKVHREVGWACKYFKRPKWPKIKMVCMKKHDFPDQSFMSFHAGVWSILLRVLDKKGWNKSFWLVDISFPFSSKC